MPIYVEDDPELQGFMLQFERMERAHDDMENANVQRAIEKSREDQDPAMQLAIKQTLEHARAQHAIEQFKKDQQSLHEARAGMEDALRVFHHQRGALHAAAKRLESEDEDRELQLALQQSLCNQ